MSKLPHLPPRLAGALERALQWLAVTAGIFAWWMAMLLLISVFTVNVWRITFEQILRWSILLTVLCSAGYIGVMIRRERKK